MNPRNLAAAALVAAAIAPQGAHAAPVTPVRCQEDAPCWNWATMGSHSRGVVTHYGTPLVVSPCRFQRLTNAGMLDYRPSDVMRGDFLAMRLNCHTLANRSH